MSTAKQMETQGSQIFHMLSSKITPKLLMNILKDKHRKRIDKSTNDSEQKLSIVHPSPCSLGCIDMVFGLTNDWSPYFNESITMPLNRLTQLLVKSFIVYCLYSVSDRFGIIEEERKKLTQLIQAKEENKSEKEIRTNFIRELSKTFAERFAGLNIYKILIEIRKSFEKCVRWYIAFGFIPVEINDQFDLRTIANKTLQLVDSSKFETDNIQLYLAAYFNVVEAGLKQYCIMSPTTVKHNTLITFKDGLYNATTYQGEDIELLSFNEVEPDCSSIPVSRAAHVLPHEYLYRLAHDTNAIQTTNKLRQSTIVVSSEPAYAVNRKPGGTMQHTNKKKIDLDEHAITDLKSMYTELSDENKDKIKFNPTAMSVLDSETMPSTHHIKIIRDMYEQLQDRTLTDDILDGQGISEESLHISSSSQQLDLYADPQNNTKKSVETIQEIRAKHEKKELQKDFNHVLKIGKHLQENIKKYIEKHAVDSLKLSLCKLKEEQNKNYINDLQKEVTKLEKTNSNLSRHISNMSGVVADLTKQVSSTQDENDKFLNLIMKEKSIDSNDTSGLAWEMSPNERTEIVSSFLSMLNKKTCNEHKIHLSIPKQYEDVLLKLKVEVIPLFKVQNKKQLDIVNSWVPQYMSDKCSSFVDIVTNLDTEKGAPNNNIIQIHETKFLKVIDVNPISAQEQERIKKIVEVATPGSEAMDNLRGPLVTKKFYQIQFPQTGNVGSAIDKNLSNMWTQMIKTMFSLDDSTFTITGQKMQARPTQQTYETFIIPYLRLILGYDTNILQTIALLMEFDDNKLFENGAYGVNTFIFHDIFNFFWDNKL